MARKEKKETVITLPPTGIVFDIFWRTIVTMAVSAVSDIALGKRDRIKITGIFEAHWGKQEPFTTLIPMFIDSFEIPPTTRCYAKVRQGVSLRIFELSRAMKKNEGLNQITIHRDGNKLHVEYQIVTIQEASKAAA